MARIEEVHLGPCRAYVHAGAADGAAIVLPGASYSIDAPLLWFSRQVLHAAGRTVVAANDAYRGEEDPRSWVEARATAALDHLAEANVAGAERPLIVGKSISTLAAPLAAQRGLPGVWLTPLLRVEGWAGASVVVEGLRAATAPLLLVGGGSDGAWDAVLARSIERARVLEVPGADHSLSIAGDAPASLSALGRYVATLAEFASEVG